MQRRIPGSILGIEEEVEFLDSQFEKNPDCEKTRG